jgi:hypothetical protein
VLSSFAKGGIERMSHIVSIQTKVHDPGAISAACQRLQLPAPTHGTVELFSGEAAGLIVPLPGWEYGAVIDPLTGTIRYDNFEGAWGDQKELNRFMFPRRPRRCL